MNVAPGAAFEATTQKFAHAATVGVRIRTSAGADFLARTVTGVAEDVTVGTSAVFRRAFTAPTTAGQYAIVWDDGVSVDTEELVVASSAATAAVPSGQDYADVTTLKASLSLTGQTFADADIAQAITAASRAIDNICDRRFYLDASATARVFNPTNGGVVSIDDLAVLTSVASDLDGDGTFEQAWTENTDFTLRPFNYSVKNRPATSLFLNRRSGLFFPNWFERGVEVTGRWGWPSVPAGIQTATGILSTQLLRRMRDAPFAEGQADAGRAASTYAFALNSLARSDPHIQLLTSPYVRLTVL